MIWCRDGDASKGPGTEQADTRVSRLPSRLVLWPQHLCGRRHVLGGAGLGLFCCAQTSVQEPVCGAPAM